MSWVFPLVAALIASTAALVGSLLILALRMRAERAAVWLLSFAIGTLLGAATLGLLPEAIEHASISRAMTLFLAGIVLFIVIERVLRWRHPHEPHPELAQHPRIERATAAMLLWGDAVHNLVDGMVLGVASSVAPDVGVTTALAIFAHEVPQEIGDFAILITAGLSWRRALVLNYLSAITVLPGAVIGYAWSTASHEVMAWLLPIAAGGFVYIALADLVPSLHHRRGARAGLAEIALVLAGIATIRVVSGVEG